MPEINFAVWNLCGVNNRCKNFTNHEQKIIDFLKKNSEDKAEHQLDFIFFQEIAPPENIPCLNKNPEILKWVSCRENEDESGYNRGILLYKNSSKNFTVKQEVLSSDNPIGAKYYICTEDEKLNLCFIGFWNVPETGGYSTHLNALLEEIFSTPDPLAKKPDEKPTVYIIAGDTNVNMDSQNGSGQNTPEKCANRRKKFAGSLDKQAEGDFLLKKYGLTLINVPGIFTHKKKYKGVDSYFQCDLLMSSSPENIKVYSLGSSGKDISGEFEKWNSDHLPLFFTFSYDD